MSEHKHALTDEEVATILVGLPADRPARDRRVAEILLERELAGEALRKLLNHATKEGKAARGLNDPFEASLHTTYQRAIELALSAIDDTLALKG